MYDIKTDNRMFTLLLVLYVATWPRFTETVLGLVLSMRESSQI